LRPKTLIEIKGEAVRRCLHVNLGPLNGDPIFDRSQRQTAEHQGPAVWQHQNRDDLNGAHMPFDLFFLFFFFAITHSLAFDAPCPRNNSGAVEMNAE
jgi:hypothetical protein